VGIQVILIVSIAFQLTAAGIALSLIRVTQQYKRTWFFIAAAVLLMVFRRFTILAQVLRGEDATSSRMTSELLALVISILLVLFMLHIRPLLRAIHQAQEELERHVKERTEELSRTTAALQNEIALRQSEEKYRTVFEHTPVALWEEDLSGVKSYIDRLRTEGVTDFRTYLAEHPDAVRECASRVKVLNVNQATLDLLDIDSKEAVPRDLAWLLDLQAPDVFIDVFAGLAEGKTQVTSEEERRTLAGAPINTILGISIAPGHEDTWGMVLVYVLDITERKQAEEALKVSQTIQAAMIEAIPDMLFRFNREGRYLAAYTHQKGLLVASRDELIGNTIADVLPPQVAQMAYHHLHQAFETRETQAFEYALPVLDGLRHFEARFAVSGKDEVVVIVRDITDRKAADEALHTQRAFLRQVIDAIPSLVFAKDREGRYILGNQATADRYNVTVDELVGKTDAELNLIPEEVAQYRESDRAVFDTGQPQFIPVEPGRHATHSEPNWYQTIKVPLLSPEGNAEYLLGVATDITERKRAEEALAMQRQYLRQIIDVAPSIIFIKDPEGRYILANQALADLAQMPVEDLIGKFDADFTPHPEDRARRQEEDRQVLETQQRLVIHEEQIIDRRSGERYWFKVTKVPIMAPNRDEYCVLVAAENITAHKLAEEQTIALAVEKERSRILSDFIRDTSHEFGTPLAVMRTSLYVLDQMLEDPSQARHLQTVKKQVQYIETLVQNLLTMSRLDSGDEFMSQPIDLRWLIESIAERFDERIQAKRLGLHLDFEDGLPTINGDPKYLHTALENLVDNAIHYTPPEGAITIRTRRENARVVVEVQDTGIGIPEDRHELIFARFYRIDQARSDRGAGLGLPIARKIIDGHQGTITVDSAPGQGSIFRVFLPIPPG
jgi:PAS domain S-box-containing protein